MRSNIVVAACLAMLVSGCASTYVPPKDNEAHALLKLKFKYSAVRPDTQLGARMHIRLDAKGEGDKFSVAFNEGYGHVRDRKSSPEIPMAAVKVHPGKKADVRTSVYFYWYTTHTYMVMVGQVPQMRTSQVYHEAACTVQTTFVPEAGKTYILDYTSPNVDRDCTASAYEQVQQGGGKFKLVKVGESKTL